MNGMFFVDGKVEPFIQRRLHFFAKGQKPFLEWSKYLVAGSKPPRGRCTTVYADLKQQKLID